MIGFPNYWHYKKIICGWFILKEKNKINLEIQKENIEKQKQAFYKQLLDNWISENKEQYDEIFKQQLINLAVKNDILIAISGSGNSKNILKAVNYANENGIITIGICGFDGGELKKISDYSIHIKSNLMEACEDIHSIIGHYIALWLREN